MLKFFFWILLLANAGLFAYRQLTPGTHEPARMRNQLNADKIKLIPAGTAASMAGDVASNPAAAPAAKPEVTVACTEIGNFNAEDAKRFGAQLAALQLGDRVSQRNVREVLSHMVYIPPQGDREGAEKKVAELRRHGVEDLYIIQDNSDMQWGISLGVFKQEEGARAHLAELNAKGVRTARIGPHSMTATMVIFRLRDLDADTKAGIDKIKAGFPKQEMRNCAPG
jgi:hypothetical protein